MVEVNIYDAKTNFSKYAKRVKAGETIVLCDRNVPFAEIKPLKQKKRLNKRRILGIDAGVVELGDEWDSDETNQGIADLFNGK